MKIRPFNSCENLFSMSLFRLLFKEFCLEIINIRSVSLCICTFRLIIFGLFSLFTPTHNLILFRRLEFFIFLLSFGNFPRFFLLTLPLLINFVFLICGEPIFASHHLDVLFARLLLRWKGRILFLLLGYLLLDLLSFHVLFLELG